MNRWKPIAAAAAFLLCFGSTLAASIPRSDFEETFTIIQVEEFGAGDGQRTPSGTQWKSITGQSARFLSAQHGVRLFQKKTRKELGGPFFKDYGRSLKGLGGWGDGDGLFTNYVAHPMQGASSGFVFVHGQPGAEELEFGRSPAYWKSRLKALGFAFLYSTQFELGPYSEATIGNVGKAAKTMGMVDFIITPVGGLGWMLGEDLLDRFVIRRLEKRSQSKARIRFFRVLFNPTRSVANLLRFKAPWYRPNRTLRLLFPPPEFEESVLPSGVDYPAGPVLEASRQPILELDHSELEQMLHLCCQ